MRIRMLVLTLLVMVLCGGDVWSAPKVGCNGWLNGNPKLKKVTVYWFLETRIDPDCGAGSMNSAYDLYKDDPNVCFMGVTSGAQRVMKPWVTSKGIKFPIGCGVERRTHVAFAVLDWPTVVIANAKGELAWRGSPSSVTSGIEDVLKAAQEAYRPKAEKKLASAKKDVDAGKYGKAYKTYFQVYAEVSKLKLGETIQKELKFFEDRVISEIDSNVFHGNNKSIRSITNATKKLIKAVKGSPLVPKLEQRLQLLTVASKDTEMLFNLQMAHLNRLLDSGQMDVAYKGMNTIQASLENDKKLEEEIKQALNAQLKASMGNIERIVANRIRYLIDHKDSSFQSSVDSLSSYFADTPIPDKITHWITETEELKKQVAMVPKETKAPKKATTFISHKKENKYDSLPVAELKSKANAAYKKGNERIKGLSGDSPDFDRIISESIDSFLAATQMYAAAIAKSDELDDELRSNLRDSRRQLFFCHKMARN